MVITSRNDEQNKLSISRFERLLLSGDAKPLINHGYADAAAVASGNFTIFLPGYQTFGGVDLKTCRSVRIAQSCIETSSTDVTLQSAEFKSALTEAAAGSQDALIACYVAGVSLIQAFVRENWAGPSTQQPNTPANETAAFFLAVDGEDVARPARCLEWLRAAKYILVDSIKEFVRLDAMLVSWWATRVLLAQQSVLSNPTPTLQYELFHTYGRFLGAKAAETRHLFGAGPNHQKSLAPQEDSDDEDCLFTAPIADGDDDLVDEDAEFNAILDENNPEHRCLLVLAYLELALAQKIFYDGEGALRSLQIATRLERIAFQVGGELGVRTKFQSKPTAQLIARAFGLASLPDHSALREDGCIAVKFPRLEDRTARRGDSADNCDSLEGSTLTASLPLPKDVEINDSDVLGYIKLTEGKDTNAHQTTREDDSSDTETEDIQLGAELTRLTPLQQALTLGHASVVRARNASHILTKEEMAPYVNLVLQNATSPFGTSSVVQIRALMLRVSFEREKGRYLERCMAQMEEIGKFISDPLASEEEECKLLAAAERNMLVFGSSLPPLWELKKELAISFGKLGLVKSAMEIFEKLEYWDELVDCHRLIGNLGAAETMVREQLDLLDKAMLEEGTLITEDLGVGKMKFGSSRAVQARAARRPRLLCVLGDVTRNTEHFETAWVESGYRYARAKRALGRMCVEAEHWEGAVEHFKQALEINSLFPEVWFTYGCSALKIDDMPTAAHAFTRVVQQTPDNGEAWNNLARVLHELGKKKEALNALREGAKTKRDSWRIWENMLILATEIRASLDIVRAMERLLELRGKDGVAAYSIGVVVSEVIRMSGSDDAEDKSLVLPVCKRLLKILGRSTSLVSTNPSIWAAYAELHELVPKVASMQKGFDCRLKQVRCLIAHANWTRERVAFRHMVIACDALCKDAVASGNKLNVRAARIQVQSVVEQTHKDFRSDEGFERLTAAQATVAEDSIA